MRFETRGINQSLSGLMFVLAVTSFSNAIDLAKDSAIRLAPEDSDIYVGAMQLKEQWNQFATSKIYNDVAKVPCVEKLIGAFRSQWEDRQGQVGQVRQMIDNPNVESLIKLAQDMFSDETFFFADGQVSEAILSINSLSEEIMTIARSGDQEAILDYFLQIPKSDIDEIPIPTAVIGFKVQDQERVLGKLDELEGILRFLVGSIPSMQSFIEGLERIEDSRGVRIAWTIIPEMIPWSQIRRQIPSNESGQIAEKMQTLLADRQICLTIGQLDGYLIFGLSEDSASITDLGNQASLWTNPDLKPVLDNTDKQITSVSYVSDAYADAYFQMQLKDFFSRQIGAQIQSMQMLGVVLPRGFESLPDDLAWIDEQIEELVPDLQGQTSFTFLSKTGSEVWSYARTENVLLDATKPLDILEHVGGDPMMLLAFRLQDHPEYFATARRIVRKIKEYLDLMPEMESLSDSDREAWKSGLDRGWPLVVEFADIWENKFLPSMKEGQHAWVLREGTMANKQWCKDMPESKTPLAIPEIATVSGLSDKKAMSEAWPNLLEVLDSALTLARELKPNSVSSDFKIPKPVAVDSKVGEKYTLRIPEDYAVPGTLLPQVLLTDRFMFSSYSDQQSEALIKTRRLSIAASVVTPSQACASVSYLDLGRIAQFIKPWITYAIETANGSLDAELIESQASMPALKGSDILDLWNAFASAGQLASVTTQDDDGGSFTRVVFTRP